MTDLRRAAEKYAAKGRAVFPLKADKSPATKRGFHDATTDPDVIAGWSWAGMLGAVVPEGQLVVDIDPRNGGTDTMDALADIGHVLPETKTAKTGGGGTHHYLDIPRGLTLRGTLGPGVDIKRPGKGYVVVPPSPGYTWAVTDTVARCPAWLLDELVVPENEGEAFTAAEPKFSRFEQGTHYGLRAMSFEIEALRTAGDGGRNNALNKATFSLSQLVAGGELDADHVVAELMDAAAHIGLEDAEARQTLDSAWAAGEAQPRQRPESTPDERPERSEASTPAPPPEAPTDAAEAADDAVGSGAAAEPQFWSNWWAEDEPEPPYYIHAMLPKNAYVLVYGPTEAAKSMTWNGILAEGSRHGLRSSVYSLENPPHTDRDRLRRLGADPAYFRLSNQPLDLNDARQLDKLVEREKTWPDGGTTDVLLIDTYSHAFNSRSEDGNAKAIDFARRVRWIMHEVGCSVVVIDHTGYQQKDEPRDASAKRQAVDVAILMDKRGQWRMGEDAKFTMSNKKAARFANPFEYNGRIKDVPRGDGLRSGLRIEFEGSERPSWPAD